jgi:hypothetical protein
MGIEVSIKAGTDVATSSVNASGSVQHVITDTERTTFGIPTSTVPPRGTISTPRTIGRKSRPCWLSRVRPSPGSRQSR